jgi:hypothetical protein
MGLEHATSVERHSLRYFEQRLAEALPLYADRKGNAARVAFRGDQHSVEFLSALDNAPLGGGLYRVGVSAQEAGHSSLVMRISPYRQTRTPSTENVVQREVADNLSLVSFRYFGPDAPGAPPAWHATWVDRSMLPLLVEVTLKERHARSPAVIRVAPRIGRSAMF